MANAPESPLRERLRDADPAGSASMTRAERNAMRARLLGAAADQREGLTAPGRRRPRWATLAAATATVAFVTAGLLVGLLGWPFGPGPGSPPLASGGAGDAPVVEATTPRHPLTPTEDLLRPRTPLPAASTNDLPAGRTIHFTAPRGTRLVWVVPGDRPEAG